MMTTSLRNLTSDNVEVSLDQISSIRFGDYLSSIPLPAVIAVFRAEQLDPVSVVGLRVERLEFVRSPRVDLAGDHQLVRIARFGESVGY